MFVSKIQKVKRYQIMEEAVRLIFKFENFDTYIIENTLIRDYGTRTINPNKSSTAELWPPAQAFSLMQP